MLLFFIITLVALIALSGHFFESAIAGIHFIFFIILNHKYKLEVNGSV